MSTLVRLTERINAGVALDDVLEHLYSSFHEIIPYQRIGLALLEDDGRVLRARWARSPKNKVRLGAGYAAKMNGSSLSTMLETGKPRILNDLEAHLAHHPRSGATRLIVEEGFRSSLTCPLVARGEPIGFLFFSSTERGTYAGAHVQLFEQIAGQVATIVEKSEMHDKLVRLGEDLQRRNDFIRQTFGRYVDDDVVERLLDTPGALQLGGQTRQVAILMSDLRGFTNLSDVLPAADVVALLNHYLSSMVEVIERCGGTIDEFIGDAILIVFGAIESRDDDTDRAISCAIEMQRAMEQVNRHNQENGWPPVEMGIAIHTGEAIVGNIGSTRRTKFGVVGQTINLTSRLQSQLVGGQVAITSAVSEKARLPLRLGRSFELRVKGIADSVRAFDLLGIEGGAELPQLAELGDLRTIRGGGISLRYRFIDGGYVHEQHHHACLMALSLARAVVVPRRPLRPFSDICFSFVTEDGGSGGTECCAKVLGPFEDGDEGGSQWLLHFTSLTEQARGLVRSLVADHGQGCE